MKLIYHIIVDEKFIDVGLRQFEEVAPKMNVPVYIGNKRELSFVKRDDVKFCTYLNIRDIFARNECGAVIFHSLPKDYWLLLKHIPAEVKVFWLGWGYDYYDCLLYKAYPDGLLLPETKKLMDIQTPSHQVRKMLIRLKRGIKTLAGKTVETNSDALARVDYFCPVLEVEYKMSRELNSWFIPQFISWNYGTAEDDLGGNDIKFGVTRNNILVGNSATPENNHIEIFQSLRESVDLTNRKIIVPLSYGNTRYRNLVVAIGKQMFGEQFVPLIDYMPIEEYIALLDSCGFVFMNHLRQQAMGNIFIMMMKGARLYINHQGIAYKWLVDKGAAVFAMEDLRNELVPINTVEHEKNIAITMAHCGREIQLEKTRQLVSVAIGKKVFQEVKYL